MSIASERAVGKLRDGLLPSSNMIWPRPPRVGIMRPPANFEQQHASQRPSHERPVAVQESLPCAVRSFFDDPDYIGDVDQDF